MTTVIRVKAVKTVRYGGKKYAPGHHFEATPKHVKALVAARLVSVDKGKEVKKEAPKATEVQKPKVDEKPKADEKVERLAAVQGSGQYGRRDMTAEERSKK